MTNHPNRSKRGRPPKAEGEHKRTIGISLDPQVIAAFDALGAGKHVKANAILRAALVEE